MVESPARHSRHHRCANSLRLLITECMYRVISAMSSLLRLWNEWQRELKFGNASEKLSLHSQQATVASLCSIVLQYVKQFPHKAVFM